MKNENSDVLIYAPFNKKNLNEKDVIWINAFQTILEIGLNQITKQKLSISNFILDAPKKDIKELGSCKIIVQLILNNSFSTEALVNESQLENVKVIQVNCHPEIKGEFSTDILRVNLFDETTNKSIDLSENIGEIKNDIWLKILDIAFTIKKDLVVIEKKDKKFKGKIFVAETSIDQNSNRETIIRELEHLGFEILPKVHFPKDLNPFSELIHDSIKQSVLSIHLIGNHYAPLINNIEISSIELQNDLFHEVAAELNAENREIKRLVWIPTDVKPKSEKQRLYIGSFKRNIELLKNTEIIQTPIEIFKSIIRNKANGIIDVKPISQTESKEIYSKSVYIITNDIESKTYNNIKAELSKQKLRVLEISPKTNKIDLIQEHYYNLINCDAVLIDYTVENVQWLNSKLCDLLKAPGFGRKKSFLAKSIFLNTGATPVLQFQITDLELIKDDKKDIAIRLKSFIEKIN
ncbi:MAG: hypothetical protein PF485_11930 [Bacteroidales bacterium]|jgi:DNA-directed RNA polymerase subunit F|nr:hypothetical protein [Bacteroidales bacterium]